MKTNFSKLNIWAMLAIAAIFAFGLQSCKPKGCTNPDALNYDPDATNDDGNCELKPGVMLHFHPTFGTSDLALNQEYQFTDGRKISFTKAQFYVSGIQMTNSSGGYSFTDNYLLVKTTQMMYDLGTVPVDMYDGITFDVGVDSAANHSDPSTYDPTHPLAPQAPVMHWSWNSGYQFIKIEGAIDTSDTGASTADYDFELHIGMDAMLRNVDIAKSINAEADGSYMITMDVDWSRVFDNIDMTTAFTSHTMDNMPVAMHVANNMATAITLQ